MARHPKKPAVAKRGDLTPAQQRLAAALIAQSKAGAK